MRHESPVVARTLRLTLGTSLAFGVRQLRDCRLAFLDPLLTVLLSKAPQVPTLKTGVGLVLTIAGVFGLALVFIVPLLKFPIVALFVLALYLTFLWNRRGGSPFAVLMSLTMIPVMASESIDLSIGLAGGLAQAALMALLFSRLALTLVPAALLSSHATTTTCNRKEETGWDTLAAMQSTAMLARVLVVLLTLGLSGYFLVSVFMAIFAIEPSLSTGIKGGWGLIAGKARGGAIAIAVYELTVVLTNLLFPNLLVALVCLALGPHMFSGGAAAALCGTALSTVLLIIGMTVSPI